MTLLTYVRRHGQGSAISALPFVLSLLLAAPASAASVTQVSEPGHLDGGVRYIMARPDALNSISQRLPGYPDAGGNLLLYGAGGTLTPGMVRAQVSAWTGGVGAQQGSKSTRWDLNLGSLTLEQRYPMGAYMLTAGTSLEVGELRGALDDGAAINRVQAPLYGAGLNVGARWPAQTRLGFFTRAGYNWLSGGGEWRGPAAAALGTTQFDLGGPSLTAQLELAF